MSGIIDISKLNTPPEKHELETAKYFAKRGHDVVFLNPCNICILRRPAAADALANGRWASGTADYFSRRS